jgi:hypothetical protein
MKLMLADATVGYNKKMRTPSKIQMQNFGLKNAQHIAAGPS